MDGACCRWLNSDRVLKMIPFNKPYLHGRELLYIAEAVASGKISGDGVFSKKCHSLFEEKFAVKKALLTTSCTDALEMSAVLLNIKPGDEVIVPSYTFVSTANAFVLRGAKIIFADSLSSHPNIDSEDVAKLVTSKTKAIVPVHYAGVACNMDDLGSIASSVGAAIVEDAAQAIDSSYRGTQLGTIGTFGTFSFHETKNIISGEGGLLSVNDEKYFNRAEIIREKGTNRSSFFRGEVDKYGWVDIGSSYLPSDIIAAYLYAQLEMMEDIQAKRKAIWNRYYKNLEVALKGSAVGLPYIPPYATNNAHMFYLICETAEQRASIINVLKAAGVHAVFHYISLHSSKFFGAQHDGRVLAQCDRYSNTLLRLPLYYEMTLEDVDRICSVVEEAVER